MNNKKFQSGSAHLVIIIVLTIALLGSLGYVFYLNFMQPKAVDNTPAPVVVTPTVTDSTKYFAITQWGIKGEYSGGNLKYEIVNNSAKISSDAVAECASRVLNVITKYAPGDVVSVYGHLAVTNPKSAVDSYNSNDFGAGMRKIGDNYYLLNQGTTDACSDDTATQSVESQSLTDISRFFLTLREQ